MNPASIGIREAKQNLSRYLKMVQQGKEIIITDRGRPVGKIVPFEPGEMSLEARIRRLETQGIVERVPSKRPKQFPSPLPIEKNIAQKFLQEHRNDND
jgi:prevent-host-death family protein